MRAGDPPVPRGKSRTDRGGGPTPSPTAHLAGPRAASRYAVLRPSLFNSATRRAIGRNLALDLLVAVGMGVTMALINAILPTVARRGGLAPIGLSALAAAPYVANLLGAFAGRFGPRNTAQLTLTRGVGAASLLVLFFVTTPPVMVVVAVIFWLSLSFGGPFHLRLWGAMYPARLRGRV